MEAEFPTLTLAERDRRWKITREMMKVEGVECLIVPGLKGREALEGYLSNDYAEGLVVFPLEGEPVHLTWTGTRITRRHESALRGVPVWVEDMRVGCDGPTLVKVLKEKGFEKGRIGVVGLEIRAPGEREGFIPYTLWAFVLRELPHAAFLEMSEAFVGMMIVKSEEELTIMRHSARIGEAACLKMLEMAAPGLSELDLYAAIVNVIFKAGASPPPPHLILHSGLENLSWGPPMWIYQGGAPRILQKGDMVLAEIFPRYGGLESQQQMAVHLKPANDLLVELGEVARRCYEVGISVMKAGKTFREVCDALEGAVSGAGYWHLTPLIHSLAPIKWTSGSAVGIEQAAGVEWAKEVLRSRPVVGSDLVLKPGMVFELEPNACKGRHRVNIGGTVIVTERGVEELNHLPTKLHIK